jgi:hypothetical protein
MRVDPHSELRIGLPFQEDRFAGMNSPPAGIATLIPPGRESVPLPIPLAGIGEVTVFAPDSVAQTGGEPRLIFTTSFGVILCLCLCARARARVLVGVCVCVCVVCVVCAVCVLCSVGVSLRSREWHPCVRPVQPVPNRGSHEYDDVASREWPPEMVILCVFSPLHTKSH